MGIPVVIAENGQGFPVTPVEGNAPVMTVAENGLGAPIVISEFGAPFVVEGITPPIPPVPGPLDYIENGEGLSEIRVEYDLARPVAMMGIAFRHDGSVSSLTATHGGDALELVDFILNEQENIGSATFIGNGLKIEPADLVITPVGGTIGPAVMRIDDSFAIDYVEVGIHEGRQGASYIGAANQPVPVVFSPVDGTGWGVYALACASAEKFSDARGLNGAAPTENLFWGVASSGTLGPVPDWATVGDGWSQDGDWWEHTGATSYLIGEDFGTPVQNPFWWEIEVDVAEGARLYVQTVGGGGHLSELFMGPVSGVFRRYRNQNYTGYRFNIQSIGDAKFRNFQYCTDGQTVYGSFGRTVNQVPEGSSLQFQIGALSRYAGIVMEVKEGIPWYDDPIYKDMSCVADFQNGRYAITAVPLEEIPSATADQLKVKKSCSFSEFFATPAAPVYEEHAGAQRLRLEDDNMFRFSPVVEAIAARTQFSVIARGISDDWSDGQYQSIIGLQASGGDPRVIAKEGDNTHASTTGNPTATAGVGGFSSGFGVGAAQDASGRSLCFNGGVVASNVSPKQTVTQMYLGTTGSGPYPDSEYGGGWYDAVLISPDRLSNSELQGLAMPQANFT